MKYNIKQQGQTIENKLSAPKLILFLDDNPIDFELAHRSLQSIPDLDYLYVKNIKEFKEAYLPQKFAAIFSDYSLDGEDCTEIIPIVRKQEMDLPIILISGTIGEERAVELLRLGITDFVFKDRLLKLPFVLTRALKEYEVKKAERLMQLKIQVNEEKLRKILESIEDVYFQADMNGYISLINPSCNSMLLYKQQELLNKNIETLFLNDNFRDELYEQIRETGKIHNYETELKRKDDSIIYVSININYVYNDDNLLIGIQGIIRDITEKTKRNKELAQSYNELFNIEKINKAANEDGSAASIYLTLLNALNSTIGITSSQVYSFNKEKNKLFLIGEAPEKGLLWLMEEKSRLKLREVTPVLSSESSYRRVIIEKKILITENSSEITEILSDHFIEDKFKQTSSELRDSIGIKTFGMLPIVAKDSVLSLITFNSTRHLSESEKKSIIRFVQQASVVLDKMNVQKYLSQNEERYRVFFEKNQGLLCTHDLEGKILTINNAAARSLNYTVEELMTMNIKDLLHPSLKGAFEKYIKEIIQKKSKTGQFVLLSKDSETKNWYYSNYLYDESDKKYVIGTAQDITDRIKIKEEKLRSEILKRESEEVKKMASQLELYSKKLENSIDYAKRLKDGMHVNIPTFQKIFTDSFIIDFPKDIIGGDFYWLNIKNNKIVIALADCTGHGVPGALLAAMGCTMLNNIFLSETNITPIKMFEKLNFNWRNAFIFNRTQQHSYDGMEISLCCVDYKNKVIEFCGIGGEIFIYSEDKLTAYKGNSFEINQRYSYYYNKSEIVSHKISYSAGDRIYLFSDGYCDQFSEKNKYEKLSKKRFKKLIEEIQHYDMNKQRNILIDYFEKWKGNTPQIDDVMILGIQL